MPSVSWEGDQKGLGAAAFPLRLGTYHCPSAPSKSQDRFYHEGQPRIFAENWLRRVSRDRLYSACFVLAILLSVPSCHFVPFNLKLG
ncbi:hypothetical protein BDV37DRAFT_26480 [Aspergillus pseudonomiae]|uniref:Uncharacterized protein n=1 Tax=Aspergillus pseudonomiae TaxID=1506151 RepID=A0A5N7CWJ5_9EURO|nr:uncharacterized protein BDV37DRAFT_26480 [Aspergillus pseudonomiae]KAE8398565.1 hypothetical protein BDV37DRAFT_26480 [Aspergillus pseudonomiae]